MAVDLTFHESVHRVVAEVIAERERQHAKWGEQNHPDGTGPGALADLSYRCTTAEAAKGQCERAFARGTGTYAHIMYEEVCEAFEERDLTRLRTELVQVAAVAVAWVEKLDRDLARRPAVADSSLPSPIYVFTCRGNRSGHFVYTAAGRDWASVAAVPRDVADSCDVQRDPSDPYARLEAPEGRIRPTNPPPGWSYVAWWDHQGDNRGASSTGILARGHWTAQQLLDAARRDAPWALRVRVYGPGIEEVADAR